jgi:hypothetical protein
MARDWFCASVGNAVIRQLIDSAIATIMTCVAVSSASASRTAERICGTNS